MANEVVSDVESDVNSDQDDRNMVNYAKVLYQSDKSTAILPIHKIKIKISDNKIEDFNPKDKSDFIKQKYFYSIQTPCDENCAKQRGKKNRKKSSYAFSTCVHSKSWR